MGALDEKQRKSSAAGGGSNAPGGFEAADAEAEENKKDYSHLLSVFNIYKNKENFNASGFFNGGLDTGIEPSLLAVDIDSKE